MQGRMMLVAAVAAWVLAGPAVSTQPRARNYIDLETVRPLLARPGISAPADLPSLAGAGAAGRWLTWVGQHDRMIRQRLREGDEDTLVNWLLLGRSFTSLPPVTDFGASGDIPPTSLTVRRARIDALLQAVASPGADERRRFARAYLESKGLRLDARAEPAAARNYLLSAVERMLQAAAARARGRTAATSAPASVFAERGLSLDTSLQPNFALERSLRALKTRGLVAPGSIRRIGIIGAGLDFADKDSGFDFYPVQTVQPFAVLDTLRRLDLAPRNGPVAMVALDISSRVLEHIATAKAAAPGGYVVRLPLARRGQWTPELRRYWGAFGDQIGQPVTASPAPPAEIELRAVRIAADAVAALGSEDVNVIVERSRGAAFDLVVATNVLLYYGPFDQAMALSNVGAMLRRGGVFLTNTALPDLPSAPLRRIGSEVTLYTTDGRGDEMIWYQREAARPAGR
jgi:hypothetical protein